MVDELKTELSRTGFTLRKLALHIAECPLTTVAEYSSNLAAVLRDLPDAPTASKNRYAKRDTTLMQTAAVWHANLESVTCLWRNRVPMIPSVLLQLLRSCCASEIQCPC
jgi:hypothetical protein